MALVLEVYLMLLSGALAGILAILVGQIYIAKLLARIAVVCGFLTVITTLIIWISWIISFLEVNFNIGGKVKEFLRDFYMKREK